MPEKQTLKRAAEDKRKGKSASTQAGEFVREEIHHVREGKHGARSTKQAIATGLSKARKAGVKIKDKSSSADSPKATRSTAKKSPASKSKSSAGTSRKRSEATTKVLKKEGHSAAYRSSLSKQTKTAAKKRSAASRSDSAKKAARTKGATGRSTAARKAAKTRAKHSK